MHIKSQSIGIKFFFSLFGPNDYPQTLSKVQFKQSTPFHVHLTYQFNIISIN